MKLSTREDIAAPIGHVFAQASDFDTFERRAIREGAQVTRHHDGPVMIGTAWDIAVPVRGRIRQFTSTLTAYHAPDSYTITAMGDGLVCIAQLDLVALSPRQTRAIMKIDITARNLTARLLLQSLKLVKTRLSDRLKSRMHNYASVIADSYRTAG
ncbi:MAG: SRPBCC family protein [Loktanella sp.]|nr:SRPBCC family protein [Loktanella sp.]